MARSSYFYFDGLEESEKTLARMIEQTYPEEFRKMVIQLAYELQGQVKERTPVDTSRLADSWTVGNIVKRGGEYYIEVFTNVEYAEPVEYGHRTRGGAGFVKGAHMMELSLEEVNRALPGYLQDWLSDFIEAHEFF